MEKEYITLPISELKEYKNNPRKNADAVKEVVKSIRQCGYIEPIVIDENNVILAGHTRLQALKKLKIENCDVLKITGLDDVQKKKYRILDNYTNQFAEWDLDKLDFEIENIQVFDCNFEFYQLGKLDKASTEKKQKEKKLCPYCGAEL